MVKKKSPTGLRAQATKGIYVVIDAKAGRCALPAAQAKGAAKKAKTAPKKGNLLTTRQWLDQYLEQSKGINDLIDKPKEKVSDDIVQEIERELI